jgi:hypothetical protein
MMPRDGVASESWRRMLFFILGKYDEKLQARSLAL